jgi:hypothetical protein
MIDDATAFDCCLNRVKVAQVSASEMDGKSLEVIQATPESNQANHFITVSEQMTDEVGTNKTGSASDEDFHPRLVGSIYRRHGKKKSQSRFE